MIPWFIFFVGFVAGFLVCGGFMAWLDDRRNT